MNPIIFDDDNVLKAPLTCKLNESSSQVSQPLESLETRLQNLSLTAPVSTPEVSSVREDSSPYPHLCGRKNSVSQEKEKPVNKRRYLRMSMNIRPYSKLRRERHLQAKQNYYARICRDSMCSTSCIPSSSGTNHEVNGRDSIRREARQKFSITHFWCFDCRQSKPRSDGVLCVCVLGNFCCGDCNKEWEKTNPAPPKFDTEWARANPLCFSCGVILSNEWRKIFLCESCNMEVEILKVVFLLSESLHVKDPEGLQTRLWNDLYLPHTEHPKKISGIVGPNSHRYNN
ncbi:hypothetical protein TNCV_787841 [Trichonephila clavipes]|nr:hypothetical protein TNCV_787841 [Trichonephila clavipes]